MEDKDLMLMAYQRSALMALVANLLEAEDDVTLDQIKAFTVNCFIRMIDRGHMVGDNIDAKICNIAREYCEQAQFLEQAKEIINSKN